MYRHMILFVLIFLAIGGVFYGEPIAQDPEYHQFSDQITLWAVPNFLNVMSNIAFVFVGVVGVLKARTALVHHTYRIPYLVLSYGIILTAFGSGWYHLSPSNDSLVWDRLPMTIAFMSMFSLIIRDYVHGETGRLMLFPAMLVGFLSILYWYMTEQMGAGDLRPYGLVQFLPLLLIPFIMILYKPLHSSRFNLAMALLFYLAAKGAEFFDGAIYGMLGNIISGHSLKHLLAAVGSYYILKVFLTSPADSHYAPPVPQD